MQFYSPNENVYIFRDAEDFRKIRVNSRRKSFEQKLDASSLGDKYTSGNDAANLVRHELSYQNRIRFFKESRT